jgi:hypothetical protein
MLAEDIDFPQALDKVRSIADSCYIKIVERQRAPAVILAKNALRLQDYPLDRISATTARYLETGYCAEKRHPLYGRYVFPVHNHLGQLLGAVGRAIGSPPDDAADWIKNKWPGGDHPIKYLTWGGSETKGFPKGNVLFNYHRVKRLKTNFVILVEGPFDLSRVIDNGIYSVVALLGSDATKAQIAMLTHYPTIIYALDEDTRGPKRDRLIEKLHKERVRVLELPLLGYKDIGEMPERAFRTALRLIYR